MKTAVFSNRVANGVAAAAFGAERIRTAIKMRGEASIIVATGTVRCA